MSEPIAKSDSSGWGCGGTVGIWFLVWFLCALGPLSLLSPLVLVVALAWCIEKRLRVRFAILLLLNPFTFLSMRSVVDYCRGNLVLHDVGMPKTSDLGLDRRYRCRVSTSGCIPIGNEWVFFVAYDFPARLLLGQFGWMPGTYTGPYPTEQETIQVLDQSEQPISVADFCNDAFSIGDIPIRLDHGVGQALYDGAQLKSIFGASEQPMITGTIWKDECVILRIPLMPGDVKKSSVTLIVCLSRSAGRPFAYYSENDHLANVFPVPWKRSWSR